MADSNPYASGSPMSKEGEKLWAVAGHLLAIPFEFFGPVFGYILFSGRGPFITHHVRESLNFGITMLLSVVVLSISIVGLALLWILPLIWTIFRIIAAIKTSQGEFYRYPIAIRFFRK